MVPSRRAAMVVVLGMITSCGSTVGVSRTLPGSGPRDLSQAQGVDAGAAGQDRLIGSSPRVGRVPTRREGTAADSARGTVLTQPIRTAITDGRRVPSGAPGVTDKAVYMGVVYCGDCGPGYAALGAGGAAPTYDVRAVWQAVFDFANAHGGFAGRRIVPVWFRSSLYADTNTELQAACDFWTKDHRVFAMIAGDDIINECAERAGAIPLGSGTAATFRRFPHLVHPDTIALDRLGVVTVNGLHKVGYFAGKLGLVTWDEPDYRRTMEDGYLPALAEHGLRPVDTYYVTPPQDFGGIGNTSAAISSAITKFQSEGIDHVILQDGGAGVLGGGGGLTLLWMNQAKSQRYYPRYGQNIYNSPGDSLLPADQQDHAIAIDQSDFDRRMDAGFRPNAVREKCHRIMQDAGMPVANNYASDQQVAGLACDFTFMIHRTINSVAVITNDSVVAALPALGRSLGSALVYGNKFVPGRRDGGSLVRAEEYFADCECLRYLGTPYDAS
jgi:hypothetical protein